MLAEHLIQFGGSAPVWANRSPLFMAPGPGSAWRLVHVDKRWVSLGEGGHVDFAPNSEEEGIILEELRASWGMFPQNACSGPGPVNLYRAIIGRRLTAENHSRVR